MKGILLFLFFFTMSLSQARVQNFVLFIGQVVKGAVNGAPLSVDSTGHLLSGIPNNSAYNDSNFTCGTTDAVVTGVTLSAPPAGTYEVSLAGDANSATAGVVATVHFESNGASTTHGQLKVMPFAGGTLTTGNQRIPFAKTIVTSLNGTNALEVWCSTSSGTVTTANVSLTYVRLL